MQNNQIGIPLEGFSRLSRAAAAEGAILLKNENNMLPLQNGDAISVFGRCQIDYYRSGTGSGGAVNIPYSTNLLDSLRLHTTLQINEELAAMYTDWIADHPFDNGGGGWACEPWHQEEMPLTDTIVKNARSRSEKALVVIGRTAGEDKDNSDEKGSFLLTDKELSMLSIVASYFEQTAVIFNVSNIIDMSFLENQPWSSHICSLLYVWQGGMEGGNAAADIICGIVTPSGKLPDTIARSLSDYPSSKNYGNRDRNFYQEDIYVGYRYFETFAPERVLFPFGYGLSYASFSIEVRNAVCGRENVRIKVSVTNTHSAYSGKEVVQLYCEAPQGKLGRPRYSLCAFAKTRLLAPGESELLTLTVPYQALSSYDDSNATGHKSCYVLEAGEYIFHIGSSIRDLKRVVFPQSGTLHISSLIVTEQLEEALSPVSPFSRLKPGARKTDGTYEENEEAVPQRTYQVSERIQSRRPSAIPQTGSRKISLADVKSGKNLLSEFIAQFSDEELACLVRAEGMSNPYVTPGTASAFGGLLDVFSAHGLPIACCSDGPSGIRMESGLQATQMPIGTLLASTWNPALIENLYQMEGQEMILNQIDNLLGPGMNIHRNPQNGRNFEYFSEDPFLTGMCAIAVTNGIHKYGATCTLKHFCCNNQETARHEADSIVSERALREIYLKGFEMVVRNTPVNSVMTAYNPINGSWAASNYDLTTTILRKEWGFQGIVMTDWWAHVNDIENGGLPNRTDLCSMVRAQNDLYMVVPNGGSFFNKNGDNLPDAIASGTLSTGELQECAMHICSYLLDIPAFYRGPVSKTLTKTFAPAPYSRENCTLLSSAGTSFSSTDKDLLFWVEEKGLYAVTITYACNTDGVEQNTCNFFINGKPYHTLQCGGTNGNETTVQLTLLYLECGAYSFTYQLKTNFMKVNKISFELLDTEKYPFLS